MTLFFLKETLLVAVYGGYVISAFWLLVVVCLLFNTLFFKKVFFYTLAYIVTETLSLPFFTYHL